MCVECDKRFAGLSGPAPMALDEAMQVARAARYRTDDPNCRAFDALLTEMDRLNEDKRRWDSLRGLPAEETGCGA